MSFFLLSWFVLNIKTDKNFKNNPAGENARSKRESQKPQIVIIMFDVENDFSPKCHSWTLLTRSQLTTFNLKRAIRFDNWSIFLALEPWYTENANKCLLFLKISKFDNIFLCSYMLGFFRQCLNCQHLTFRGRCRMQKSWNLFLRRNLVMGRRMHKKLLITTDLDLQTHITL